MSVSKIKNSLSGITITEYLRIIQRLYADLEIENSNQDNFLEQRDRLSVDYLKDEIDAPKLIHAMGICAVWLRGSPFSVLNYRFIRERKDASWSDLLVILFSKLAEYENQAPVICITLSKDGVLTREICGTRLLHTFNDGSSKSKIVSLLAEEKDYIKTAILQKTSGLKSEDILSKVIHQIKTELHASLQLPKSHPFIENKPGAGYRINPVYNVVIIK